MPEDSSGEDEDPRDAINALNPKRHAKTVKTMGASRITKSNKKSRITRCEYLQILESEGPHMYKARRPSHLQSLKTLNNVDK